MNEDLDTYFLADNSKVNVPDVELGKLVDGQTTSPVRGLTDLFVVKNTDGTYAGTISRRDMDQAKAGR
jgi:hypothetical protein